MAAAGLVSAGACLAARRAVPWQGRQAAVVMAVGMLLMATGGAGALGALLLGALMLASGMIGTMGVRGAASAAGCCHRALGALVMAICAFHGAAGAGGQDVTSAGHTGHSVGGALGALIVLGTLAVVGWTLAAALRPTEHRGRTARLLAVLLVVGIVALYVILLLVGPPGGK